jgi:hypothetical protein
MRGAILPLPQYVFTAWCLVKHRDNFASPFTYRWGDNIKKDLREIYYESVNWGE